MHFRIGYAERRLRRNIRPCSSFPPTPEVQLQDLHVLGVTVTRAVACLPRSDRIVLRSELSDSNKAHDGGDPSKEAERHDLRPFLE